jgi:nicotinamidase-related amidase
MTTRANLQTPNEKSPFSDTALLLIDFINDLEFEGGEDLAPKAIMAARATADLKSRAHAAGISVIYVNDNFNEWRSDFHQVVNHCLQPGRRGKSIAQLLKPSRNDYFVLKPRNSGFFMTPLKTLLEHLKVKKLILTGLTADNCVLFTANDAYLNAFKLWVAADCIASIQDDATDYALRHMGSALKAKIALSTDLVFERNTVTIRRSRRFSHKNP